MRLQTPNINWPCFNINWTQPLDALDALDVMKFPGWCKMVPDNNRMGTYPPKKKKNQRQKLPDVVHQVNKFRISEIHDLA